MKFIHHHAGFPLSFANQGFSKDFSIVLNAQILLGLIYHRLMYYFTLWTLTNCDEHIFISRYCRWEYFHYMPKWYMKRYFGYSKNPFPMERKSWDVKNW